MSDADVSLSLLTVSLGPEGSDSAVPAAAIELLIQKEVMSPFVSLGVSSFPLRRRKCCSLI